MLKPKGAAAQRDYSQNGHDDEDDLIEQLNRKLSNVTLNPTTPIPDEMNIADISTMASVFEGSLWVLCESSMSFVNTSFSAPVVV